jgi:pimeloyl-ACP methyl ester carboxylesterase
MSKLKFRFRGELYILDDEARSSVPVEFVDLADGIVHYDWDPTFEALTEAGFRVLRYDLYGWGYSDRPDTAYNQDLFQQQLSNLLSALNISQPIDLIGLSMGGPVSIVFTHRHPAMVRKLCLIDPAGLSKSPLAAKLIQAPLVGELVFDPLGERILVNGLTHDFHRPERFSDYVGKYRPQMQNQGFRRAFLSTLRNGMLDSISNIYEQVGKQDRPTLLIWGREDKTIPFETNEQVRAAIPHVEFHPIDNAGHTPHHELPEVVNPILIEFLGR